MQTEFLKYIRSPEIAIALPQAQVTIEKSRIKQNRADYKYKNKDLSVLELDAGKEDCKY